VEDIGLRSTSLRTFDRTVFTIPNGQIANVSLENFSLRDSFWFHHIFSLRYETTAAQMRSVLQGITGLLEKYPLVKHFPTPVRFLRLGAYSLDVEIFTHLAIDLGHFLELQAHRWKYGVFHPGYRVGSASFLGNEEPKATSTELFDLLALSK